MIITKIYQTAMSRAKLAESQRHDFYFYIDEFQNFATETFENILSEARKYRLCLTISHQFLSQVPADIKGAVFGNIGSMIAFRVGADDGDYISKEYYPVFTVHDFINLGIREVLVKMSIDGHTSPPFSAFTKTVPPPPAGWQETATAVLDGSRQTYTRPLAEIEAYVSKINTEDEVSGEGTGEPAAAATAAAGGNFDQPLV
jgi:hypothetical protein